VQVASVAFTSVGKGSGGAALDAKREAFGRLAATFHRPLITWLWAPYTILVANKEQSTQLFHRSHDLPIAVTPAASIQNSRRLGDRHRVDA
jgi:hypothetical protein